MKKLGWIVATMSMAGVAQGATLVQYASQPSVVDSLPVNSINALVEDASVVADPLTAQAGLVANTGTSFNWRDWDVASTTFEAAVAANDYWSFGFDATADITLTSMDIRLDRSGTGPDDFEIRVSVNGGTATTVLSHDFADSAAGVDFVNVDLSALPGIQSGDSVDFIMAAYNSESAAGTFDLETIDYPDGTNSLTIYGNTGAEEVPAEQVPMPFVAVLISMLGLAGIGARLSRRSK
ncbi:MAG: hypothetical protein MI976_02740 [Pseudomonadales bacterium]|nr:hypothetical protein [Pseudomonadales bacterium]